MAISKAVRLHPGVPALNAYIVLDTMVYSSVTGSLALNLVAFASKEDRDRLGAAVRTIDELAPVVAAGDQASAIPMPANATAQQKAAVAEARLAASATYNDAVARHKLAVETAGEIEPLRNLLGDGAALSLQAAVPRTEIAALLGENGEPDRALCYGWLMARPATAGAEV